MKFSCKALACLLLLDLFSSLAKAQLHISDGALKRGATAKICLEGNENDVPEKAFVIWQGQPWAIPLHVQVGIDNSDTLGLKVRVSAFNSKNQATGQINGPGTKDDTFLTGQPCTFTPPKPGNYSFNLEVLDTQNRAIRLPGESARFPFQTTSFLIYQPPTPQLKISYSGWSETPGQSDVYQRSVGVEWKNTSEFIPKNHSFYVDRAYLAKWLILKFHVEPTVPLHNLSPTILKQTSWLSSPKGRLFCLDSYSSEVVKQFFRYDPTRDLPHNPDFFQVKAQAAGFSTQ